MTGSNNRVYVDEFGLFNYDSYSNLIAHGGDLYLADGNPTTLVGNEFWLPASPADEAGIGADQFVVNLNGSVSTLDTFAIGQPCLLYTSPSPRDATLSRMPSSA